MCDSIKNSISRYYTDKLKTFGATPRGVDWNSSESQELRFSQLTKLLPDDSDSFTLLDWGCGYGALYDYLLKTGPSLVYTGYDFSVDMINACKIKFPDKAANWYTNEMLLPTHDFTIASGIFNVKMEFANDEWLEYVQKTLQSINKLSKSGFSFNILTSYSDNEYKRDYLYYADPCFFFDYCKRNFSKDVALLHDYKLYEFSIIVRK